MTPPIPATRYARSGDVNVAYQVVGEGPIDLVYVRGSSPTWSGAGASAVRALPAAALVVFATDLLDKRGTGMSDPVPGIAAPAERIDDIRAVMDAAGSERAVLLGVFEGAALSLDFAAARPDRIAGLVLYASLAKFTQDEGYPWGWSPAAIQLYLAAPRKAGVGRRRRPARRRERRSLPSLVRPPAPPVGEPRYGNDADAL